MSAQTYPLKQTNKNKIKMFTYALVKFMFSPAQWQQVNKQTNYVNIKLSCFLHSICHEQDYKTQLLLKINAFWCIIMQENVLK